MVQSMHPGINVDQPSENTNHANIRASTMNQGNDFGENSVVGGGTFADNMAYVDSLNKEERYMSKAKAMFDDDGSGNTGIEIMRAEEDIKEVKQNFYRVMHCAFAKYEQGFKRKNEYLERRRVKRKEEIERGV